jgi:hypothetical protein
MSNLDRNILLLTLLSALSVCGHAQTPECDLNPTGSEAGPFVLDASSGTPVPQNPPSSYVFSNNKPLVIRLMNINPFAFQCSVTTSLQAYQETALSGFLGIIGGVANVGSTTPNPSPAASPAVAAAAPRQFVAFSVPQPPAPQSPCVNQYLDQVHNLQVIPLQQQRDAINTALGTTLSAEQQSIQTFSQGVVQLRSQTSCPTTVQSAASLAGQQPFPISLVGRIPLDQSIDQLANQAQSLLSNLTNGMDATCKQSLQAMINEDSAFLTSLVHGTTAVPAAADQWRSQLTQLNAVNSELTAARANIEAVLQNRQNFTIDTPVSGNQTDVKFVASCSPVAVLQVSTSTTSSVPAGAPTIHNAPAAGAKPAATPAANTWSQDFRFGPGPRFILSGGVVVSPLPQMIFSTSNNPAGSTPANIIVETQKSGTRILPLAMLSARFWDQLPYKRGYSFIPNYLSVGVTAKSTGTNGTSIEYLLGLSWAFAERQIFVTAGAYAGWQQRLGGGLAVGQATSLSSANLPLTLTTVWKPGFSITWAPAGK